MIKLVCGRSRAGKTTYCKNLVRVIHLDRYGYYPNSVPRCIEKVSTMENDAVVDGIFSTAEERMALLEAYKGGGDKVCVWIDTPTDVIEHRFSHRPKPRNLPQPFEPPTYGEGWDEIIVVRNGEETVLAKGE